MASCFSHSSIDTNKDCGNFILDLSEFDASNLASIKGRSYVQDTYRVDLLLPLAAQYSEGDCTVTAFTTMLSEEPS